MTGNVWMYVDGYNFYYSLKHSKDPNLLPLGWCDFRRLGEAHMLHDGEKLERIRYFTSAVSPENPSRPGEFERQNVWLKAVRTIQGLDVIKGRHIYPPDKRREEKLTDVNIAVEMLLDAMSGSYDRAILLTADVDLAPAVRAVEHRIKDRKNVTVWVPPGQSFRRWKDYGKKHKVQLRIETIGEEMLNCSLLPYRICTPSGEVVCVLDEWRLSTSYLSSRVPKHLRPDTSNRKQD